MKTDALDYALATILFIVNEENEVYLVAFHFHTFTVAKLSYNIQSNRSISIMEDRIPE